MEFTPNLSKIELKLSFHAVQILKTDILITAFPCSSVLLMSYSLCPSIISIINKQNKVMA